MTTDGRKITCVEFYDETPIDNMCAALTNVIDELVVLGTSTKAMERSIEHYDIVLRDRNINVEFKTKAIPRNDISILVDTLTEIALSSEVCLFDLTGGEDLLLVAAGIVYERLKGTKEIQMHKFDITAGTREKIILNCDGNSITYFENDAPPKIDVVENVKLAGGTIVSSVKDFSFTMNDALDICKVKDLNTMWELYKAFPNEWNHLGAALSLQGDIKTVKKNVEFNILRKATPDNSIKDDCQKINRFSQKAAVKFEFVKTLLSKKLISNVYDIEKKYYIEYKNDLVRECLKTSGKLLELKVFERCVAATDKEGNSVFNSVETGVKIDWSDAKDTSDIVNEIDVIAMHGMVPVCISCKNGQFDTNELYKIGSVAQTFGKKYARKIIVATALENASNTSVLRERAKDMKIKIVDNFCQLSDDDLAKLAASFWQW